MKRDAEAELNLPPGFRFHPTDEELVVHYLCRKVADKPLPVPIIADVDLYKFDPWELPERALFGQKEWYFLTPRDRKYPNGSRPNRAAGHGYWKATGADKPVAPKGSTQPVGIKKALVFYCGRAPRGVKTDWIMHEYRLAANTGAGKKGNHRLDDWVLCRLYNKKNNWKPVQNSKPKDEAAAMDLFSEVASHSFGTPESEVDHVEEALDFDSFLSFGDHPHKAAPAPPSVQVYDDVVKTEFSSLKEENDDWSMGLNFDELHNSFTSFTSVPITAEMTSQDYFFSNLI